MSAPLMSAALRTKGLTPSEKVLYAYLCDRADADLVSWPSIDAIAEDIDLSRRGVLSGVSALRLRGLIRVENRYKQSSFYHIQPNTVRGFSSSCPKPADPEPEFDYRPGCSGAESAPEPCRAESAPQSAVQNLSFSGAKTCNSEVQNLHPESPIESPIESPSTPPPQFALISPDQHAEVRAQEEAERLDQVASAWNEMAADAKLPQIIRLTPARRSLLRTRLKEVGGLRRMLEAIDMVGQSPFLRGEGPQRWRATFDFLLERDKAVRVLEGIYSGAIRVKLPQGPNPANLTGAGALLYRHQMEREARERAQSSGVMELAHG